MNKKKQSVKEYVVVIAAVVLFVVVSGLSVFSLWQVRDNSRVITRVGFVSGTAQQLVKRELQGYPDDELILQLDGVINELLTGEGENGLPVLNDAQYQSDLKQVKIGWEQIKEEIYRVRDGGPPQRLYALSEEYLVTVKNAIDSATEYSERQLAFATYVLLGAIVLTVFIFAVALAVLARSSKLRKKAEMLNKIAYIDPLTSLPNRASSEQAIAALKNSPPEGDLVVFMFDMNNLKTVNNMFGRNVGDKLIAAFGRVLSSEAAEYGFVGRFGGDEFIAIFQNADEDMAGRYLSHVNERIVTYNLMRVVDEEKISFSVGYCINNMRNISLDDMITESERRMYLKKREIKGM